jgi:hypothetical protein
VVSCVFALLLKTETRVPVIWEIMQFGAIPLLRDLVQIANPHSSIAITLLGVMLTGEVPG